ncbi:hypothetical protein JCM10049v2_007627 [Rhodotorula toruloides]
MLPRSTSPTASTGPAAVTGLLSSQRWTTGHEGEGSHSTGAGVAAAIADAGEEVATARPSPMCPNAGSGYDEALEPAAWTREEDSALSVAVGRSAVGDWEGVRQAFFDVTGSPKSASALSERWEVLRLGQLTSRKYTFNRSSPDPLDFSREETTLRWLRVHHSATPPDQHSSPSSNGFLALREDSQVQNCAKRLRNAGLEETVGNRGVATPTPRQDAPAADAAIPSSLNPLYDEPMMNASRSDAIRAIPSSDAASYTSLSAGLDPVRDPSKPSCDPLREADFAFVADDLGERDEQDVLSVFSTDPDPPQQTSAPTPYALPLRRQPSNAPATTDPIELVVQGCALPTQTSPPRPAPAASSFSTSVPLEPLKLAGIPDPASIPPRPSTSRRFPSVYRPSPNRSSTLRIETTDARDDDNPPPPFKPRLLIKGIAKAARRQQSTAQRPSFPSRQVTSEPVEAAEPSPSKGGSPQQRQLSAIADSPTTLAKYAPNPHEIARPSSTSIQQQPSPPPSLPDTTMSDSAINLAGQNSAGGGSGDVGREKETAEAAEDWQAILDGADRLRRRLLEIAASLRV